MFPVPSFGDAVWFVPVEQQAAVDEGLAHPEVSVEHDKIGQSARPR